MAASAATSEKPRFAPGQRVKILDLGKPGHVRTPQYVRHKVGEIERFCGAFENPENRAYGLWGGPAVGLYRVRFKQTHLWSDYRGPATDTLEIEIFEHWLAPAGKEGVTP